MAARELRYLSSKYNTGDAALMECLRKTAKEHSIALEDTVEAIYNVAGMIKLQCAASDIGGRRTNEDTHTFQSINVKHLGGEVVVAGVFDGHGGQEVSKILSTKIAKALEDKLNRELTSDSPTMVTRLLTEAIVEFDEGLRDLHVYSGSTLTLVLITTSSIFSVNLGDSRTVVFTSKGDIIFETADHKPTDPSERRRIEEAGGRVWDMGVARVNGNLSLSRAIGDFSETDKPVGKPYSISNIPDVKWIERDRPLNILLACDGIWDVLQTDEAIKVVSSRGCVDLVKLSLERGSLDNLTVMVVKA